MKAMKILCVGMMILFWCNTYALDYSTVGGGSWSTLGNWDDGFGPAGVLPGPGDNVIIYHNITQDIDATINSLDLGTLGVTLTVSAGQVLTVGGAVTDGANATIDIDGTLSANSIFLDVGGLSLDNSGLVDVTTSVTLIGIGLTNTGTLNVGTTFSMDNGSLTNSGTIDIEGSGTFSNGPTITNTGLMDFSGLLDINTNGGSWDNTGGTVNGRANIDVEGSNINPCLSNGTVNYWGVLLESTTCKITGNVTTLPVELKGFYGFQLGEAIQLEWGTASEKNNDYFAVEHSFDGIGFSEIGSVEGNGTVSISSKYLFVHDNPVLGSNYYRLQQVDYDGTSDYSDIIAVFYDKNSLLVYPTIVSKGESVTIEGDVEIESARLISVSSGILFHPKIQSNLITTSNLPRDGYRLQLVVGGAMHDIPITIE